VENVWKIGLFVLIICGGIVFATATGIIPTKTGIELTPAQVTTLTANGINAVKTGGTICEETRCTLQRSAECKTMVTIGDTSTVISFPKCECKNLVYDEGTRTVECKEWHYFSAEELAKKQLEELTKAMAKYADELAKPTTPKEKVVVIAPTDYNIQTKETLKTCKDLGGAICAEKEVCDSKTVPSVEGDCCLTKCMVGG